MSISAKLTTLLSATTIALLSVMFGLTSNAAADCVYQYNANGFSTSATPVFNSICGVPDVGDEANFVRIRPDVANNDEDDTDNPAYSIGTIDSSCQSGDTFDIWNYVHNNASQNDNPDVGDGSAVATGTYIDMAANQLNTVNNQFTFTASVGANNAATVNNMTPAVLNCDGNNVELSLVSGSVHQISDYGGTTGTWTNLADNSLNTNLPIGSTNAGPSSYNSGTMWGCWYYRIVIVYEVKVTAITPTVPVCTDIITSDNQADIEKITYSPSNASISGYLVNVYSGVSTTSGTPVASSSTLPYQLTGLAPGQYTVVGYIVPTSGSNITSSSCMFTYTVPTPPPAPKPPTPPVVTTSTPTTTLPSTGPSTGGIVGIFAGATTLGSGTYYWLLRRRISKN